jgi:hypothetical protein
MLTCARCFGESVYQINEGLRAYDCALCGRIETTRPINLLVPPTMDDMSYYQCLIIEIELSCKFEEQTKILTRNPHIKVSTAPPTARCERCDEFVMFDLKEGEPEPLGDSSGIYKSATAFNPKVHDSLRLLADYVDTFIAKHKTCKVPESKVSENKG